jgi:hypothetical protein
MSPHFREIDAQAIIAVRTAQSNFGIPADPGEANYSEFSPFF